VPDGVSTWKTSNDGAPCHKNGTQHQAAKARGGGRNSTPSRPAAGAPRYKSPIAVASSRPWRSSRWKLLPPSAPGTQRGPKGKEDTPHGDRAIPASSPDEFGPTAHLDSVSALFHASPLSKWVSGTVKNAAGMRLGVEIRCPAPSSCY
jgi:hypothetical protein